MMTNSQPLLPTADQAARELQRRRRARTQILPFVQYAMPTYEANWHHAVLCRHLDRFVAGDAPRLMVFMPPQHGKSQLVSRMLPAFIFGHHPDAKVIAASYAAELIQGMNRDVQRIMEQPSYTRLFPDTRLNSKNIRTVSGSFLRNNDIFEIVGRRGQYRCAGVGGGLTGFPCDYGIIDDPYKDYREATSPTVRRAVYEWYTSVFLTRTHATSRLLLTLTRWHEDDLAARILDAEGDVADGGRWTVVRLPAICDDPHAPDEQRQVGEALWPARFPLQTLLERKVLNSHQFEALYQQRPQPREGAMFQRSWFGDSVRAVPADAVRVRWWDKAATEGDGDWTVGVLMARSGNHYYVEDVVRVRYGSTKRDALIRDTAVRDAARYGPYGVTVWGPQDPGQAGKTDAHAFRTLLAGHRVFTEIESGSKEVRADPFASQCGAGNVHLVHAPWNDEYVAELEAFPLGTFDDQVDASSGAFSKLVSAHIAEAPMAGTPTYHQPIAMPGTPTSFGSGPAAAGRRYR